MKNDKIYTLTILAENKPGIIYRVAGLFLRRKINLQKFYADKTEKKGISQMVVTFSMDPAYIDTVIKQLERIIEVTKVSL
jgi:acetolactate synthase I/III small subunit